VFSFSQEHCHGVKRNGSHSWESESPKASKHPHIEGTKFNSGNGGKCVNQCLDVGKQYSSLGNVSPLCQGGTNVNLWPPFSLTSLQATSPCSSHGLVSCGICHVFIKL
jgi:period circadian protein